MKEFDTSLFTEAAPGNSGTVIASEGGAISADPVSNDLFVTEGERNRRISGER